MFYLTVVHSCHISHLHYGIKLNLKTEGTREVCIKTFGSQSTKENLEKVKVQIKALNGSDIFIYCYVKDICHPITGQNIKLSKEKYRHLRHLPLANNMSESQMSIDILIGSDYYWSIIENDTVRGPPGSPVAVDSKVGYIFKWSKCTDFEQAHIYFHITCFKM